MNGFWRTILGILEVLSYAALAMLVMAVSSLILLNVTGICTETGLDQINCSNQTWQGLAELSVSWVILTVFTGIPGLLAIAGVIFGLRRLHNRRGTGSFTMFLLKGFAVIIGIAFVLGMAAAIMGGA